MGELSHFDKSGAAQMVDVGAKEITQRTAVASGQVVMEAETLALVRDGRVSKKGDVLETARLAGIMAAKRTDEWIPLCHTLPLDSVKIEFSFLDEQTIGIRAETKVSARTGVEMEALVATSTAALTIYDMCKAVDRSMRIERIQVEEKIGGRSGHFTRTED